MAYRSQIRNAFRKSKLKGPSTWKYKPVSTSVSDTSSLGQTNSASLSPYSTSSVVQGWSVPETPDYQGTEANARHQYTTGLNDLRTAQDRARYDFGLDGDTRNPFSRAAMIKQNYQQNQARNTNSYAARGLLYSGASDNAQTNASNQYLKDDNDNQVSYRRAMEDYATQERKLGENFELGMAEARRQADLAHAQTQVQPEQVASSQPNPNAFSDALRQQQGVGWKMVTRKDGSKWKVFKNGTSVQTQGPRK